MTRNHTPKSLAVLLRARMQPNPIPSPAPQPTPLPPPTDTEPAASPVASVRYWLHASASAASPLPAALDSFSDGYRSLDRVGRREVLRSLAIDYDVPRTRVLDLMRQYMGVASAAPSGGDDVEAEEGKEGAASALYRMERGLRDALRPRYAGFLEAMNAQPGGLKLLAMLRADLLALLG